MLNTISGNAKDPRKRFSRMISLHAKNLESAPLAEPHFCSHVLLPNLHPMVSCRTLRIAEPTALNSDKDYLAEPSNAGSFRKCPLFLRFATIRCMKCLGEGSGGVKSTGISQSVRETRRDESQNVLSTRKLFKTRDLELPIFEGSFTSCSPHSAGYTCTSVHPYFPVAKVCFFLIF